MNYELISQINNMRKPPTVLYNPHRIMQRKSELQSPRTGSLMNLNSMVSIYERTISWEPIKPSHYVIPLCDMYSKITYTYQLPSMFGSILKSHWTATVN